MPSNYDDRLKDYVDVKERVRLFYDRYPDGRLVTAKVKVTSEPDGVPRVWAKALAYRTPDDPLPGVGWSWMVLPGSTSFTKGSEAENTETSAWGRAIGALGIGIEKSIASVDEVRNKASEDARPTQPEQTDAGGLIGTVIKSGTKDFELRETPDGWVLPFKIKNGSKSFIVFAEDKLAQALKTIESRVIDQRVTVWGNWTDETIPAKGTKPQIKYRVLHLERIETPDGTLPPAEEKTAPYTGPMFEGME